MAETTLVINHINILKTLISQLIMLGHKIEEIERVELLLQSLPDSYNQIDEQYPYGVPSLEEK